MAQDICVNYRPLKTVAEKKEGMKDDTSQLTKVMGIILAGGASRRMGGQNKALLKFGPDTFIDHCYKRLKPQVDEICISTNVPLTLPFEPSPAQIPDRVFNQLGPMAGIYNAGRFAEIKGFTHLMIAPVDAPFLPQDWRQQLEHSGIDLNASIVTPTSGGQRNYLFQWFPVFLLNSLKTWLDSGGRAVKDWLTYAAHLTFDFQENKSDRFDNINTPDELERLVVDTQQ